MEEELLRSDLDLEGSAAWSRGQRPLNRWPFGRESGGTSGRKDAQVGRPSARGDLVAWHGWSDRRDAK